MSLKFLIARAKFDAALLGNRFRRQAALWRSSRQLARIERRIERLEREAEQRAAVAERH